MTIANDNGYRSCACRDCMEIAIGEPVCWACEEAGCDVDGECQVVSDEETG